MYIGLLQCVVRLCTKSNQKIMLHSYMYTSHQSLLESKQGHNIIIVMGNRQIGMASNFSKLDLTTFCLNLSKITSNLPENYLSRSKTTSEKSYSSKK